MKKKNHCLQIEFRKKGEKGGGGNSRMENKTTWLKLSGKTLKESLCHVPYSLRNVLLFTIPLKACRIQLQELQSIGTVRV